MYSLQYRPALGNLATSLSYNGLATSMDIPCEKMRLVLKYKPTNLQTVAPSTTQTKYNVLSVSVKKNST